MITIEQGLYIVPIVFVISLIITLAIYNVERKFKTNIETIDDLQNYDKQVKSLKTIKDIQTIIFTIIALICISFGCMFVEAHQKGAKIEKIPITKIYKYNKKTPYQSSNLPKFDKDLKNKIILYQMYGCSDCLGIEKELNKYLSKKDKSLYYIVNTGTPEYKRLSKLFPITEVPSGVYIDNNLNSVTYLLFKEREFNDNESNPENQKYKVEFVKANIDRLFELQNRNQ